MDQQGCIGLHPFPGAGDFPRTMARCRLCRVCSKPAPPNSCADMKTPPLRHPPNCPNLYPPPGTLPPASPVAPCWLNTTGVPALTEAYSDIPWTQKLDTYRGNEFDEALVLPFQAIQGLEGTTDWNGKPINLHIKVRSAAVRYSRQNLGGALHD
jgi:hypothetical protein